MSDPSKSRQALEDIRVPPDRSQERRQPNTTPSGTGQEPLGGQAREPAVSDGLVATQARDRNSRELLNPAQLETAPPGRADEIGAPPASLRTDNDAPPSLQHDLEANYQREAVTPQRRFLTGDERGWLSSAARADLPPLTEEQLNTLRDDAAIKVRELLGDMTRDDADAHGAVMTTKRMVRGMSAYADMNTSSQFLDLLRDLKTGNGPDALTVLEALAGEIDVVKRLVNPPSLALGDENSLTMRSELNKITDSCASSVASLAIDRKGGERAGKVAMISSMTGLPILAGYFHDPKSYFYLAQVAGAYSRTAAMATGLVRSPQTDNNVLWAHAKDRQILWCLPFFLFFATTFGPLIVPTFKEKAKELGGSPGLLGSLAGVAFGTYIMLDHATKLDILRKKVGLTDAATQQYVNGKLNLSDVAGTADNVEGKVLDSLKRISGYVDAINGARREYKKEQPLSTTLGGQLLHLNKDVEDLKNNLALVSGRIKEYLLQLAEKSKIGGGSNDNKGRVSAALFGIAAFLSVVSSAAIAKEPLLLTDYVPYYAASLIRLGLEIRDPAYSAADVEATFANLFGGTLVGFPASALNVGLLYTRKQSWVDLSLDELFGNPAAPKIGFGMFTAYYMLINLTLASKVGPYLAARIVGLLSKNATSVQQGEIENVLPPLLQATATMLSEIAAEAQSVGRFEEVVDNPQLLQQPVASGAGIPRPLTLEDEDQAGDAS